MVVDAGMVEGTMCIKVCVFVCVCVCVCVCVKDIRSNSDNRIKVIRKKKNVW